jgi:hypothetical protein
MPKAEMMTASMLLWQRRRILISFRIELKYRLFFVILFNREGLVFSASNMNLIMEEWLC